MGDVSWFLGCHYQWSVVNGKLEVRVTQSAYTQHLLDKFGMSDCYPVKTPYYLGLVIDRIPHKELTEEACEFLQH